jgi:putative RNA 2'-phosphotransferase
MVPREAPSEIRFCLKHGYFKGNMCDCGSTGKFILSPFKAEKLGKIISGALRHFPAELSLNMDTNGWVNIGELEIAVASRYSWASPETMKAIFSTDRKGRYEVSNGKVRARYGHSIKLDLDYPPAMQDTLFYGTSEEEADRILDIGLKPVNQSYVHLSKTIEEAVRVACIRTDHPVIISLDAKTARSKGIKIIDAGPVCLSEPIPPDFIRI